MWSINSKSKVANKCGKLDTEVTFLHKRDWQSRARGPDVIRLQNGTNLENRVVAVDDGADDRT
jgi:hypothetical protein